MADIVNMHRARKAKDRLESRAKADENAAKFGLTKADKAVQTAKAEKAKRDLDGAKRE
jgi:Spy/CpxP family protein refolding chaperone